MTTDGQLHVSENPLALLDKTTDQWSKELHCGTFTYLGQPPFDVEWMVSLLFLIVPAAAAAAVVCFLSLYQDFMLVSFKEIACAPLKHNNMVSAQLCKIFTKSSMLDWDINLVTLYQQPSVLALQLSRGTTSQLLVSKVFDS